MSLFVIADPSLLAVPNFASSAQDAEAILARVRLWSGYCGSGPIQLCQLSDTVNILSLGSYFPSAPNIKALLQLFGLDDVYSTEDVRKSINTILDRAKHLIDIERIEIEDFSNETTNPNLAGFKSQKSLYEGTIRCMASAICENDVPAISLTASGLPLAAAPIDVRCEVNAFRSILSDYVAPFSIFGSTQLVHSIDDVVKAIGAQMLWRTATDSEQLHLAISARAAELLAANGTAAKLGGVAGFRVGGDFYESLEKWNALGSGNHSDIVLDTCARIVIGKPKYRIDDFRKGKKRSSPLIKRTTDGAIAQRTHITKGHEALRLMLWARAGRGIEFANIGAKNQLEIREGRPDRAVEIKW